MADPQKPDLAARLAALQRDYLAQLPQRLVAIEQAWAGLADGHWATEPAQELHRLVHNLTGSGKTFGFAELSDVARELERQLKRAVADPAPPTPSARTGMQTVLGQLRAVIDGLGGSPPATVVADVERPVPVIAAGRQLLLIGDDATLGERLAAQLGHFGYAVRRSGGSSGHRTSGSADPPAVLLVDGGLAGPDGGRLADLRREYPHVPVVIISARGDIEARLLAVRAGAAAFFAKPFEIGELVDRLDALVDTRPAEPYRVLIIEDSTALTNVYSAVLEEAGMIVEAVHDPLHTLPVLAELAPDLILMDVYMPRCSGLELASIIRQQREYVSTPIVFLSTETDLARQLSALGLGADDFLTKPIEPGHLLRAVQTRAARARTLRGLMLRDSLTGVLNHTAATARLEDELARADRVGRPLCLAVIDIDHFKAVNDSHGHLVGDQVLRSMTRLLRQRLRKTDVVGRVGGEEFVVLLPDTPPEQAVAVLEALRASFALLQHQSAAGVFTVTFSCGVACYRSGSSVTELVESADEAMYQAKQSGRNRVLFAS